jgi:S1-C subfamily serine protease
MSESTHWAFPENLQPKQADLRFNLQAALDAAVLLRTEAPEDAFTASILGTDRVGNGVVIRADGLVLTIGYLITEATSIWLTTNGGQVLPAHAVAYDQVTGLGLVLPLGKLDAPVLERGSAAAAAVRDDVVVIGHGGRAHALQAELVAKREFAGYWEYVLDEALFTAPPHPQWGGAALVDADGRLLGIGSLLVQDSASLGGAAQQGNMFVPIDLLDPILDDMLKFGRPQGPPRAWLGMYTAEDGDRIVVAGLASGGPAERAGVRLGDVVTEIGGERVAGLAALWRGVWRHGPAGAEVPLGLLRNGAAKQVRVRSADRNDFLKKPPLH